jgi:hypothetical protein
MGESNFVRGYVVHDGRNATTGAIEFDDMRGWDKAGRGKIETRIKYISTVLKGLKVSL